MRDLPRTTPLTAWESLAKKASKKKGLSMAIAL